jgi:dienelactone hydrolase
VFHAALFLPLSDISFRPCKEHALVDCVSTGHPAMFDNADVDALGACPVQFIAPEDDFTFPPELKEYVLKTMPTLGVDFDYQYFAGLKHGFATRGDVKDERQKRGLERAKNVAVGWFSTYLK